MTIPDLVRIEVAMLSKEGTHWMPTRSTMQLQGRSAVCGLPYQPPPDMLGWDWERSTIPNVNPLPDRPCPACLHAWKMTHQDR